MRYIQFISEYKKYKEEKYEKNSYANVSNVFRKKNSTNIAGKSFFFKDNTRIEIFLNLIFHVSPFM